MLLTSKGGECTVLNTSSCVYVDQNKRITTDLKEIWKQMRILHEIQKDNTSLGFKETWRWLTSWFLDLSLWVKKWIITVIIGLLTFVCIYVVAQCIGKCCFLLGRQIYERIV